jgi:protein tyrosine phosphatase (PTP) superfamily phosphohydrolase (DUF442 family)
MLRKLANTLSDRQRARRAALGDDLTDPRVGRRLWWRVMLHDHGILRQFWTNFDQVAPGVFRSNHPPHRRLAAYRARGIVAVLNLRGAARHPHHVLEVDSCERLGLSLVNLPLHARFAPQPKMLMALFDAFDTIPRPFVMHCKSGADRAGLAAALYLLDQGATVATARQQLSIRYLHLRFTRTGIQDHLLDFYQERLAKGPITIRDWIAKEYDPQALKDSFARKKKLPI